MHINEVENIVKLSKKSIRYYEEEGLIKPDRDVNNDYRIYNANDIKTLKVIKFLRELGVPINEIKMLNEHKLTLTECLKERIAKIENEESNFNKVKNMCREIIKNKDNYDDIDINKYFYAINVLNKEGFTMNETKTNRKKKIIGALIPSLIFILIFLIPIGSFIYGAIIEFKAHGFCISALVCLLFVIICLFPIIATIINLNARIKEINGGEEDEASKY